MENHIQLKQVSAISPKNGVTIHALDGVNLDVGRRGMGRRSSDCRGPGNVHAAQSHRWTRPISEGQILWDEIDLTKLSPTNGPLSGTAKGGFVFQSLI